MQEIVHCHHRVETFAGKVEFQLVIVSPSSARIGRCVESATIYQEWWCWNSATVVLINAVDNVFPTDIIEGNEISCMLHDSKVNDAPVCGISSLLLRAVNTGQSL